ncbi:MAG: DUF5069 domain-containing protein [Nitrospirales bacterium]|nr:DUF5069 domain-containing protein [Nitrospirales bacterium]
MTTSVKFKDRRTLLTKGVSINKDQKTIRGTLDMTNESSDWIQTFRTLFEQKVTSYKKGMRNADAMFSNEEKDFLRTIGATPQEIYDFVEDWSDDGEPDPDMVVAITQIRRDYFLNDQQGQFSKYIKLTDLFPPREAKLAGLEWFPRIIEKARSKLFGELPSDLMYSCGADRKFLKKVNMDPAEFLQVVRESGDDVDHILKVVKDRARL